jgi:hypothetical protein
MQGEGLKQAQAEVAKVGDAVTKMSDKVLKAAGAFVSFQTAVGAGRFLLGSIEQARDLERNMFGLETVFGRVAPQFAEFTKQAEEFGLSQSEAAKASTFLGSVLKQSGYGLQEQADLTKQLVELAADLAITYGYDVQEALLGMTALFRGEYDPIEKFGVAMKQNEINAIAAARGYGDLTGEAERFAHQQIRVELLLQRSSDAAGAFQRQSGSLFAEQEKLQAAFNNMRQELASGLLPVFARLVGQLRPLIKDITPQLATAFSAIGEVAISMAKNIDQIIEFVGGLIAVFQTLVEIGVAVTRFFLFFQGAIVPLIGSVVALSAALKIYTVTVTAAKTATELLGVALNATAIGRIVTIIAAATAVFVAFYTSIREAREEVERQAKATGRTADEQARHNQIMKEYQVLQQFVQNGIELTEIEQRRFNAITKELGVSLAVVENMRFEKLRKEINQTRIDLLRAKYASNELAESLRFGKVPLRVEPVIEEDPGPPATDWVKEFFKNLEEEVRKQNARIKLQNLGASEALVESIVGAPGDWEKVYARILAGGRGFVAELQKTFNQTVAGLEEVKKAQEEAAKAAEEAAKVAREAYEAAQKEFEAFAQKAREAEKALLDLVGAFDVLATIEPQMGRFERAVVDQLASIEDALKSAFDNGAITREAYESLLSYSRAELAVLQQIQRQRDDLARRRDLAQALINDTQAAVRASGNIANLLSNAADAAERVDMTKVIQDTVRAGARLKEFRTTIITNFVQPIGEVKSKTRELLNAYKDVVNITRTFVDNMKRLRAMGLDETLFAQLVEAGADAGGATAQALVDGGQDAVNELNGLFGELDQLGTELGEQTAQVMYGEGEEFVNGIIDGLNSQLENLENTARSLAEAFVNTFSAILSAGIAAAIAAAQRAMEMQAPISIPPTTFTPIDMAPSTQTGGGGGGAAGGAGAARSSAPAATPATPLPNTGSQRAEDLRFEALRPNLSAVKESSSQRAEDLRFTQQKPTTVINVNVKTDPTKSAAQTGTTVAKAINKAVGTGGGLKTGFGAV